MHAKNADQFFRERAENSERAKSRFKVHDLLACTLCEQQRKEGGGCITVNNAPLRLRVENFALNSSLLEKSDEKQFQ